MLALIIGKDARKLINDWQQERRAPGHAAG